MNRVYLLHGINLDKLGKREPDLYGKRTLLQIDAEIEKLGDELGLSVKFFQTNIEMEYVEKIDALKGAADFLLLNPGRWTHESLLLREAVKKSSLPALEIHLSNIYAREKFRHHSVISDLMVGRIMGLGLHSYLLALRFAADFLKEEKK